MHMIRKLRKARGESLAQLAAVLGVTGASVGYWERGERKPDYLMLKRIADHYGVTLDALVNGKEVS